MKNKIGIILFILIIIVLVASFFIKDKSNEPKLEESGTRMSYDNSQVYEEPSVDEDYYDNIDYESSEEVISGSNTEPEQEITEQEIQDTMNNNDLGYLMYEVESYMRDIDLSKEIYTYQLQHIGVCLALNKHIDWFENNLSPDLLSEIDRKTYPYNEIKKAIKKEEYISSSSYEELGEGVGQVTFELGGKTYKFALQVEDGKVTKFFDMGGTS